MVDAWKFQELMLQPLGICSMQNCGTCVLSCGSTLHTVASGHVECVWVLLVMSMSGLSGVRIPAKLMHTAGGRGDHDGSLAVLLEVLGLRLFAK